MNAPIFLDSVSKCYRIYRQPQDRFKQAFYDRFRRVVGAAPAAEGFYREHWALRDVGFEVGAGEAVGILGRNGAGKSTLLQIIAGTLQPSTGTVVTRGRITALLELGSGFNQEFTGRENVFLNAAVLGLTRQQTLERYDEIAAFADIGDFIDQPVKTYSSGMVMRLAFAVQTAVQPSVLIVDEALAVGDMYFQVKCMARLKRLLDDGVSLLFVSHSIDTVRQLCSRAVLLDAGRMVEAGPASRVADVYQREMMLDRNAAARSAAQPVPLPEPAPVAAPPEPAAVAVPPAPTFCLPPAEAAAGDPPELGNEAFRVRAALNRVQNGMAEFINVQMLRKGLLCQDFDYDDEVTLRMVVACAERLANLNVSLTIKTVQGTSLAYTDTRLVGEIDRIYEAGARYEVEWALRLPLMHGRYVLGCGMAFPPDDRHPDWRFVDMVPGAYEFRMAPRAEGMIGGLLSIPAAFSARPIASKR
jgi:lipopolysaccharide transport system ATP-binding protein